VSSPYTADLELARRCAAGEEQAWEQFILEYRPILYRAADAIDPTGGARDLSDSLFADLYGLRTGDAGRKSLFHYFQGRSSLATWLRSVLAQRFVDRIRAQRRLQPLPDEEVAPHRSGERVRAASGGASGHDAMADPMPNPGRARDLQLMQQMFGRALADLPPKDRLRLACYYSRGLTLADTGRIVKEHEATVSRQLARTRRAIRENVERRLRVEAGLNDAQVAQCFASVSEDVGPIDLDRLLAEVPERKETATDRSR
jgi:RNA polymerase sigma-70 factor (ECF subfamily)